MDKSRFYDKFKEIAEIRLRKLNTLFLDLEKDPSRGQIVEDIKREMHSFKGEAKMIGFEKMKTLIHRLEDLTGSIKEGENLFSNDMGDLVFKSLDMVGRLMDLSVEGKEDQIELEKIFFDIEAAITGVPASGQKIPRESGKDVAAEPKGVPAKKEQSGQPLSLKWEESVRVSFDKLELLSNFIGQIIISQIKQKEILKDHRRLLQRLRAMKHEWGIMMEGVEGHKKELAGIISDDFPERFKKYHQETTRFKEDYTAFFETEKTIACNLETVASRLKEDLLSLRLHPLTDMFDQFGRSIRDMAREMGKKIRLEIRGGETEIDRQMLEKLNEILLHLTRNAIDHGIEKKDERTEKGKPEEGMITLNACHQGGSVCIDLCDDGRGIDPRRIKELAVKKKIISRKEASALDDEESRYLIFHSGFSTSSVVTDISGRGVGLDVVKRNIEELKGELLIRSEIGLGTTFTVKSPLTLALIKCLLVQTGDETYAIPSKDIDRCVEIPSDEMIVGGEGSKFLHENRIIPLISLGVLLGVDPLKDWQNDRVRIVIMTHQNKHIGFVVDGFVVEQEVMIKNLGRQLGKVRNISGVTTLPSGELLPVLHTPDLFNSAGNRAMDFDDKPGDWERGQADRRKILVVEDSKITGEMEKNILEAAGYEVKIADNGREGLSLMIGGFHDLIITDLEMPGLNGLELTRRIKEDEKLRKTPVIIVTSLGSDQDKEAGFLAGADAYLAKSTFDQGSLLEAVERLIQD